jgi:hypothetical protein
MLGWIAKTWGYGTATEDVSPTEHPQVEYAQTHQESRRTSTWRTLDDIPIEGSVHFVNHVKRCLEEVRHTKWESLACALTRINQVSSFADCGVSSEGEFNVPANNMGCGVFNSDYIEGASVLIHEGLHAKRILSGEFDRTNYAGEEILAFAPQAEFLRFHGRNGKAAELENSDGRHNEAGMSAELLALQK